MEKLGGVVACFAVVVMIAVLPQEASAEDIGTSANQTEYNDNDYGYAFQYPVDWKIVKAPEGNKFGEMRVLLQGSNCSISASVSKLGKSLTKRQLEDHPSRNQIAENLMNSVIEQLYRKASKGVGAPQMVVVEKKVLPLDSGIEFYISTLHFMGEKNSTTDMVGMHYYPFNKNYLIHFVLVMSRNTETNQENDTCINVLNSFRLVVGNTPV